MTYCTLLSSCLVASDIEWLYLQDVVAPKEYTAWCSKLLVQYKAAFKLVQCDEYPTVEAFVKKYKVRLVHKVYCIIY